MREHIQLHIYSFKLKPFSRRLDTSAHKKKKYVISKKNMLTKKKKNYICFRKRHIPGRFPCPFDDFQ